MSDVFADQARFMLACDQRVGSYDADQYAMYLRLIQEETNELYTKRTIFKLLHIARDAVN